MKPEALQAFNEAIYLSQNGQKEAAHKLLQLLLTDYPTDAKLLLWLVFTSTELVQAQHYLIKLAGIAPNDPGLPAARAWVNSPEANLRPPATISTPVAPVEVPLPVPAAQNPAAADPLATYSVNQPAQPASTTPPPKLIKVQRLSNANLMVIRWIVELEDGQYTIDYVIKGGTGTVLVNEQPLERKYTDFINPDYYYFQIGRYNCIVKPVSSSQGQYHLLSVNNVTMAEHREAQNIMRRPKRSLGASILFGLGFIFSIALLACVFTIVSHRMVGAYFAPAASAGIIGKNKVTCFTVVQLVAISIVIIILEFALLFAYFTVFHVSTTDYF